MRAVYAGSFDPITLGHIDIIERLSHLVDDLIILVAEAGGKNYLLNKEERLALVRNVLKGKKGIRAECFEGLTVNFARQVGAKVIVRGIRAVADYDQEMAMASVNRRLAPDIETVIVFASPEYNFISSRLVKEVAQNGGDLKYLVPPEAALALKKKFESARS